MLLAILTGFTELNTFFLLRNVLYERENGYILQATIQLY